MNLVATRPDLLLLLLLLLLPHCPVLSSPTDRIAEGAREEKKEGGKVETGVTHYNTRPRDQTHRLSCLAHWERGGIIRR